MAMKTKTKTKTEMKRRGVGGQATSGQRRSWRAGIECPVHEAVK
jgi:hypothetical protein